MIADGSKGKFIGAIEKRYGRNISKKNIKKKRCTWWKIPIN